MEPYGTLWSLMALTGLITPPLKGFLKASKQIEYQATASGSQARRARRCSSTRTTWSDRKAAESVAENRKIAEKRQIAENRKKKRKPKNRRKPTNGP